MKTLVWLVLIVSVIVFILPFWFMLCNSFEEFSYVLPIPPHLVPSRISFAAYEHVLSQSDLPRAAYNSVVITLMTACFTVLIASLSAYGFARIDFLGREVLFRIYLFTLMLPGFLGIIPQFLVLQGIGTAKNGLIGTKAGLILLYVGAGICGNTFFLRGHMAALPKELEEAAEIDGSSVYRTFFQIVMPVSKALLGVMVLYFAVGHWNSYFTALIYINNEDYKPLQLVLRNILVEEQTSAAMMTEVGDDYANERRQLAQLLRYSVIVVSAAPMLMIYPFLQKYFDQGVMIGSVKG